MLKYLPQTTNKELSYRYLRPNLIPLASWVLNDITSAKKTPSSWKSEGAHFILIFLALLCADLKPELPPHPLLSLLSAWTINKTCFLPFISILSANLQLTFYRIPNNSNTRPMFLRESNYSSRLDKVVREPSSSRSAYSFLWTIHENPEQQTFDQTGISPLPSWLVLYSWRMRSELFIFTL